MRKRHLYAFITIPAFGLLFALTAFLMVFAIFFAVLRMKRPFNHLVLFWANSIFWVLGKRVRVQGRQNLAKGENYILVTNHSSLFDPLAVVSFYPGIAWFGKEYLLKIPLFGYLLRFSGFIPMKPANIKNTKRMLEQLVQKAKGKTIAMFPEGTRTVDGKINRFHRGFVHVLKASNLDILPVTLNGLYSLKPKNRFYINFDSNIDVIVHQPIKSEELILKGDNEIINIVKEVIESGYCI
jgi:1-acyl-sn-glycerol-3-phosphate acyltransferase